MATPRLLAAYGRLTRHEEAQCCLVSEQAMEES